MENRRKDYRHTFPAPARIRAELMSSSGPVPLAGEIVNLSVGGMAFEVDDPAAVLTSSNSCTVRFAMPGESSPLSLEATLIHAQPDKKPCYGLRFHPLADPTANENRETVIWRFLLNEQRTRAHRKTN